jgi:hypothetical protein
MEFRPCYPKVLAFKKTAEAERLFSDLLTFFPKEIIRSSLKS